MGVSVYFKFQSKYDLEKSGVFEMVEEKWDEAFDNEPYESWTWYEPKVTKRLFRSTIYSYEGAIKMPPDDRLGAKAFRVTLHMLGTIRKHVGDDNWEVQLDDLPVKWDSQRAIYYLDDID